MMPRLVFIAVLLLSLCISVSAAPYRAMRLMGVADPDPESDIASFGPNVPHDLLRRACDAHPECRAFTSSGTLKRFIDTVSEHLDVHFPTNKNGDEQGYELYVKQSTPTPRNLWPAPAHSTTGASNVTLSRSFAFFSDDIPVLKEAIKRAMAKIFTHTQAPAPTEAVRDGPPELEEFNIQVNKQNVPLQMGVDESYTLTIPDDGSAASLTCETVWGCILGLESFSQLVIFDFDSRRYIVPNAPWVVDDAPRFQHRGILIDTARHFQPMQMLKKVIDSMSYAKLNVLHWHIVDSQSFPFESRTFPLLWKGSYSSQERYTQEDMREIVEYARLRAIRVVVEFDIPGHAESWCDGYPDICPDKTCPTPLDPSSSQTFDVISGILGEVVGNATSPGIFQDQLIHLGGDEVVTTCWSQSPRISQWMKDHNKDTDETYMYMVEKAHDITEGLGRTPINWEEVFLHFGSQLDKETVIQIWLDHATLAKVVAAGYRAILSNSNVWYLDHLPTTWQQFYANEPYEGVTDPTQQKLVIGGEVCMWGETVDPSDILNTIWPRAAAAAERLWSPADVTDTDAALPRLQRFRCLLTQRGIGANPVLVPFGRQAPDGPGGCYVQ